MNKRARILIIAWAAGVPLAGGPPKGWANTLCGGMSMSEMISVTRFVPMGLGRQGDSHVMMSPNGKYILAVSQRGDLRLNRVSDRLMVWSTGEIGNWIREGGAQPKPVVTIERASSYTFWGLGDIGNTVISDVTWLENSQGILFRGMKDRFGQFGLYVILLDGTTRLISAADQNVLHYNTAGRNLVYEAAVSTAKDWQKLSAAENARAYIVGTGRPLYNILFPDSAEGERTDRVEIWTVSNANANASAVKVHLSSSVWSVRDAGWHVLSLSPTGKDVVMDLPVRYVPGKWMHYGAYGIPTWRRAGGVSVNQYDPGVPREYVVINLRSGGMGPAVGAPDGTSRGFLREPRGDPGPLVGASWAPDARAVLVWNTFVPLRSRFSTQSTGWGGKVPCLAIWIIRGSKVQCVENLSGARERLTLMSARWERDTPDRLVLKWSAGEKTLDEEYCLRDAAIPQLVRCGMNGRMESHREERPVLVSVAQNLNSAPALVASLRADDVPKVLLDPNADFRERCIGEARTVTLGLATTKGVRGVKAGLLLPVRYQSGRRYPLVIQTHGYDEGRFLSSGGMVPFAARAFAAAGMAVMQLPFCADVAGTADEIACQVKLYGAAIQYGVEHGFADADKVGIIGFSATGAQVLAALENKGLHFAAAEIEDATLDTYSQFLDYVDEGNGYFDSFYTGWFGGPPVGADLKGWVAESPGFGIYKIKTPLLLQADGRLGVLDMWEPYAILRYLGRPVEFIVVQGGTHPLSNPRQQLASQGLGLDWFRFWLEDRRPSNTAEDRRWSGLRGSSNRQSR